MSTDWQHIMSYNKNTLESETVIFRGAERKKENPQTGLLFNCFTTASVAHWLLRQPRM